MAFNTEINFDDLKEIVPKIRNALRYAHRLTSQELWGNLREYSPQDTGRLAGSWTWTQSGDLQATVATNVVYALVHNEGSDPYEIFPRRASALRFEIGSNVIYAKSVLHPGIQGTGYIDTSIDLTEQRVEEFIEMGLDSEGL